MNIRHLLVGLVCFFAPLSIANADLITPGDFKFIPGTAVSSGNGTLDLRMATFSGGEIDNASGGYNADNANNTLPNSGGSDTSFFDESYVTTGKEIKDFYTLNFPNGETEIVIFLDLNESNAAAQAINNFTTLDVIKNPTTIQGNPDPTLDVTGAEQAAINQVYTAGTLIANMSVSSVNLPVLAQGAGFADYAIFTGIDPNSLGDNDVILFNFSMNTLNNGAEELFLSGEFSSRDIFLAVPEPGTMIWMVAGMGALLLRRRRKSV